MKLSEAVVTDLVDVEPATLEFRSFWALVELISFSSESGFRELDRICTALGEKTGKAHRAFRGLLPLRFLLTGLTTVPLKEKSVKSFDKLILLLKVAPPPADDTCDVDKQ